VDPSDSEAQSRLGVESPTRASVGEDGRAAGPTGPKPWPQIRFSPRGDRFAFFDEAGDLALAPREGGEARVVSPAASWPRPAEFFADGRILVVESPEETGRGAIESPEAPRPGAAPAPPPRRRRIVVLDRDGHETFALPVSGDAAAKPLTTGDLLVEEGPTFRVLDANGSVRIEVASPEIKEATVAADGRYVLVETRDHREHLLPLDHAGLRALCGERNLPPFTAEERSAYRHLLAEPGSK
jgi:hypothetical protein